MAAKRQRQSDRAVPGWFSTLGGAALLLVVGFAVGLLAGTAWEEPDLVMDHLAGRTTELPLAAEVSAGPEKAPEPEPVARPPPSRRPAPPVEKGFSIQVGAFGDQGSAMQLASELHAGGFSVYVHGDDGPRGARFRVRVGPVPTRKEATRLAGKLESKYQLPTWILSPDSQ